MKYTVDDFKKPSPYGKFADPRCIREAPQKTPANQTTNKKKGQK